MIRYEINRMKLPATVLIRDMWMKRLLAAIEKQLRLHSSRTLSIAFVDHRTMRRLNRTYRGKDKVTDILSFAPSMEVLDYRSNLSTCLEHGRETWLETGNRKYPSSGVPIGIGTESRSTEKDLGELILAWPYIRDQAKKHKKIFEEELALLIVHGVLHLRGYDHEAPRDARKMLPLQRKILDSFLIS